MLHLLKVLHSSTTAVVVSPPGLRSIRYALEVPGIAHIDTNDLDVDAVEAIRRNVAFNGGRAAEIIRPMKGDARMAMYTGVSRGWGCKEFD